MNINNIIFNAKVFNNINFSQIKFYKHISFYDQYFKFSKGTFKNKIPAKREWKCAFYGIDFQMICDPSQFGNSYGYKKFW